MSLPIIETPTYRVNIPSTNEQIEMRPFLVKEEKILLMAQESDNDEEMKNATAQILSNCVLTEGVDFYSLPLFDIEYLFLQLRAKSVGEIADPYITCPECSMPIELQIDLSKIKVKFPKDHTNEIKLNDEGTMGIVLKYPTIDTAIDYSEDNNSIDSAMNMLICAIESIYTDEEVFDARDHTKEELLEFVENLNSTQFESVLNFYRTMPAVEHLEKCKCANCGHETSINIRGLKDFFT